MTDKDLGTAAGEIFAKAFTLGYKTGRNYIPAGGMALTAEQGEDVRAAREELRGYRNFTGYGRSHVNRLIAAVDTLFPATELAEDSVGDPLQAWKEFLKPKPIGWYRTMELDFAAKHFGFPSNPVFEDRYTAPDGGKWQWTDELQWELRCYPPAPAEPAEGVKPVKFRKMTPKYATANFGFPDVTVDPFTPFTRWAYKDSDGDKWAWNGDQWELHVVPSAPAEPAEEETKADCLYCDLLCGPHEAHKDWTPLPAHFLAPTASSPVVPAPTETGPWQRIEDVPEGVLQIKDRHGRTWLMVAGTWRFEWHDGNWYEPHTNINAQAPFVAVAEEG